MGEKEERCKPLDSRGIPPAAPLRLPRALPNRVLAEDAVQSTSDIARNGLRLRPQFLFALAAAVCNERLAALAVPSQEAAPAARQNGPKGRGPAARYLNIKVYSNTNTIYDASPALLETYALGSIHLHLL